MDIGERIKELRKMNKESQEDLANLLGKSKSKISAMEKKGDQITVKDIIEICKHYKVSADWILFGYEKKEEVKLSDEGKRLLQDYKKYLEQNYPDNKEYEKAGNL